MTETTTPDTIIIVRGNTADDRERRLDTVCEYLEDNTTRDTGTVRDLYEHTETEPATVTHHQPTGIRLYAKPMPTVTADRNGPDNPVRAALARAATGKDGKSVNVIIDSLADIPVDIISELVTEHRARVHDATHNLSIHPTARDRDRLRASTRRALEVLAGTAEHADALLAGIEWRGGRPPLGTTSEGGRLAPADNYDDVCRVLQEVQRGKTTESAAAERLDCARKTVRNALTRPELYRLD